MIAMPRLTISPDRMSFLCDGKPWIWRGTLDWPLYGRYLNEGEAVVRAVMQDRRSVGANTICCAGMLEWWAGLTPANPAYWSSLRPFTDLAADEGLRLCIPVLCDTATLLPDPGAQHAHWDRFVTTLGDKTNLTCLVANQPGHRSQAIQPGDTLQYHPPQVGGFPQILFARDNPFESANPVVPPGSFAAYCSSRDEVKGYVEVGSSMHYVVKGWPDGGWDGTGCVSVLFEGPHDSPAGPWADPGKWRQLARSLAFVGTGGGNFYSDQCSRAAILSGIERDCAVEFLGNIPNP